MILVLDAHAIIWFLASSNKLSPAATAAILNPENDLVVSMMALIEIENLHRRNRIAFSGTIAANKMSLQAGVIIMPISLEILEYYPPGLDIHDSVYVATALHLRAQSATDVAIVTADREIADSGLVPVVW